jgi:uncharacterized protein YjgD (DUF1641 family)
LNKKPEEKMPTKTAVKKRTKSPQTAKKPVKKAPKKGTWEEIQAGFKELHELQKVTENTLNKSIEEMKKTNEETKRALREANQETERTLNRAIESTEKTLNKAIGGLGNTLGSLVEHIMTPDLPQKFKKLGYKFDRIIKIKYAEGIYAEIDAILENGALAMVVEVKTTLRQSDIDDHLVRMEKVRKYADEHGDKRQFMGAIAATITDKSTREYALKKGLFVIEPSGEDVKVTKPETEPRIW